MRSRSNKEKWGLIVEKLEAFDGTVAEFCRQNQVSVRALNYWRVKFREATIAQGSISIPRPRRALQKEILSKSSPFCRVEVEKMRSLPDPEWLAEFLLQLQLKVSAS